MKTLHDRGTAVYLVSGGFKRIIQRVARELDICNENIFANTLLFDNEGMFPKSLFELFVINILWAEAALLQCVLGGGGWKLAFVVNSPSCNAHILPNESFIELC